LSKQQAVAFTDALRAAQILPQQANVDAHAAAARQSYRQSSGNYLLGSRRRYARVRARPSLPRTHTTLRARPCEARPIGPRAKERGAHAANKKMGRHANDKLSDAFTEP